MTISRRLAEAANLISENVLLDSGKQIKKMEGGVIHFLSHVQSYLKTGSASNFTLYIVAVHTERPVAGTKFAQKGYSSTGQTTYRVYAQAPGSADEMIEFTSTYSFSVTYGLWGKMETQELSKKDARIRWNNLAASTNAFCAKWNKGKLTMLPKGSKI